jgi:hypothetical protein
LVDEYLRSVSNRKLAYVVGKKRFIRFGDQLFLVLTTRGQRWVDFLLPDSHVGGSIR